MWAKCMKTVGLLTARAGGAWEVGVVGSSSVKPVEEIVQSSCHLNVVLSVCNSFRALTWILVLQYFFKYIIILIIIF